MKIIDILKTGVNSLLDKYTNHGFSKYEPIDKMVYYSTKDKFDAFIEVYKSESSRFQNYTEYVMISLLHKLSKVPNKDYFLKILIHVDRTVMPMSAVARLLIKDKNYSYLQILIDYGYRDRGFKISLEFEDKKAFDMYAARTPMFFDISMAVIADRLGWDTIVKKMVSSITEEYRDNELYADLIGNPMSSKLALLLCKILTGEELAHKQNLLPLHMVKMHPKLKEYFSTVKEVTKMALEQRQPELLPPALAKIFLMKEKN